MLSVRLSEPQVTSTAATNPVTAMASPRRDEQAAASPPRSPDVDITTSKQQHEPSSQPDDEAPLPPFEPLFTLLTNTTNNTTIHPHVRYLFADDDPSPLTDPPPQDAALHRTLVVDLAPTPDRDAWAVSWASSLTPDTAVTAAHLAEPQQQDGGRTAVLRIETVEREPVDEAEDGGEQGTSDGQALTEEFRRRLDVLKRVVAEGERRREIVRGQAEESQREEQEHAVQDKESQEKTELENPVDE